MFDMEKVPITRFRLVYYSSFVLSYFLVNYSSSYDPALMKGFRLAAVIEIVLTELRMVIIREGIKLPILQNIYKFKAMSQLFIMSFEFMLFLILLFIAVMNEVEPTYFLGFFIAYFLNLIILVMSIKLPKRF